MTVLFDKPKAILTVGLPGSAKSTWAKRMVQNNAGKVKRCNKDDLRSMLDAGHHSKGNEIFVLGARDHIIKETIKSGKSIIIDDTNLYIKHEDHIETLVGTRAEVEIVFFDISPEECIRRDSLREASVGAKVIRGMVKEWTNQKNSLGSKKCKVHVITEEDQIKEFQQAPAIAQVEFDASLPDCIIYDIDGTVALMNGKRGPFDWMKVHNDDVNDAVADVVRAFSALGTPVFAVSGRDSSCQELTENWLTANSIPFDGLYMRPAGDYRKDFVVKQEIFENHFKGKFNVKFLLDDRTQVVNFYRAMGLTVFQVAPGNF